MDNKRVVIMQAAILPRCCAMTMAQATTLLSSTQVHTCVQLTHMNPGRPSSLYWASGTTHAAGNIPVFSNIFE